MVRRGLILGLLLVAGCSSRPAPAPLDASFPGRDPRLRWDGAGNLHVVYVEDRAGGAAVRYRRLGAEPAGPFDVSPAGTVTAAGTESPPTLDILPDGTLVTGYPVTLPGKWKSEIRVQRSTDRGATWSPPVLLHPQPENPGSHSFLSSATVSGGSGGSGGSSGSVVFAWLDNRAGQMGVYAASTRDGKTFSPNQTVDAETCQCCGTELLAGKGGEVWLAYRDLEPENLRDFRVLKSQADPPRFDAGAKLSEDGWKINGCPETGVRFAQTADGALWAVWFTAGGTPGVYATVSHDGGASFAPRTLVSEPDKLARHPEIGVLPDGRVALLYEAGGSIVVRIRDGHGDWSAPRVVADKGSYPRLAAHAEKTVVAFTLRTEEGTSVRLLGRTFEEEPPSGQT